MSEYIYGVTTKWVSQREAARRDRIARQHGGEYGGYVEVNRQEGRCPGINGGRYQGWYVGPNRGDPFDRELSTRVLAAVVERRSASR